MSIWTKWLRQPQGILLRRILFQVHLWMGVALGLYVVMISVSGSFLVYRRELMDAFGIVHVTPQAHRLTLDELNVIVQRDHPGFNLKSASAPRVRGQIVPDQAIDAELRRGDQAIGRFLDPYTGADLGSTEQPIVDFIFWVVALHDDLLGGSTGRLVNGVGAILATLLAFTGAVLWWPGIRNWRHSLTIDWKRRRYGFNWSLHSAIGFWMLSFILLWGISGIYLSFPQAFNATVDFLEPVQSQSRIGERILFWLARLHFGRFSGLTVKAIWTVLGLAPAVLAVTGGLMWWHRVVRRKPHRLESTQPASEATPERQKARSFGDEPSEAL